MAELIDTARKGASQASFSSVEEDTIILLYVAIHKNNYAITSLAL